MKQTTLFKSYNSLREFENQHLINKTIKNELKRFPVEEKNYSWALIYTIINENKFNEVNNNLKEG